MGADVIKSRKRLGSCVARNEDTVYQAATDGFVEVLAAIDVGGQFEGFTDSATPPTIRHGYERSGSGGQAGSFTMIVNKNNYWEVTSNSALTIFWNPLEP